MSPVSLDFSFHNIIIYLGEKNEKVSFIIKLFYYYV